MTVTKPVSVTEAATANKKKTLQGFTLLEVITATAIAAIVLTAIGSLLMGSFQIVRLLDSRKDAALEGALIALEAMASEIQKVPIVPSAPFDGEAEKISFYQLMSSSPIDPYKKAFRLGQVQNVTLGGSAILMKKVEYSFDSGKGALIRKTESGDEKVIAEHLAGARFVYAIGKLDEKGELSWEWKEKISSTDDEKNLRAIRVVLEFNKEGLRYVIPGVEKTFLVMRNQAKQ